MKHHILTVLGFLALVLAMGLWLIMTLELKQFVPPPFEEGSALAKVFARRPVPSYQFLYVFHLNNPDEWGSRKASKASFREKGPYVFRMDTTRTLNWSDNKLTFSESTQYHFVAHMSTGDLNDMFTTVNILAMLSNESVKKSTATKKSPFINVSIANFFYDGFSKEFSSADAHAVAINKKRKLAFLASLNTTRGPRFTVSTRPGAVNQIITANNRIRLSGYDASCIDPTGTIAGIGLMPAFGRSPPATVKVFEPALGVPWTLSLQKQYNLDYEPIARFVGGRAMFNATRQTCNSSRHTNINGTFDASPYFGYGLLSNKKKPLVIPAVFTHPHFLYGDPALFSNVAGFEPSEDKHSFYIDVHAPSGLVVDMKQRTQLNIKFAPPKGGSEVIFPLFWREISLLPDGKKKMVAAVRAWPIFAGWMALACTLSLLAAAVLIGASIVLQGSLKFWQFEDDQKPHTPDDIPTDELSSEPEEDLRREQRRRALRARLPAGLPVYFKIYKGDLDDLGVTIPDWVLAKIQSQIEEQDSSGSSEDSSDDLTSAAGSGSWSTVSSRSTSPEQKSEHTSKPARSQTSSPVVQSAKQDKPAIPDQEEEDEPNGSFPEDFEEEVQNEEGA